MKYLAFFIFAFFSFSALPARAVNILSCEPDTIDCYCPPNVDIGVITDSVTSAEECQMICYGIATSALSDTVVDARWGGRPTSYAVQCTIGGTTVPVAGGDIDSSDISSTASSSSYLELPRTPISSCNPGTIECICPPDIDADEQLGRNNAFTSAEQCRDTCIGYTQMFDVVFSATFGNSRRPTDYAAICTAGTTRSIIDGGPLSAAIENEAFTPVERKARDPIIPRLSIPIPGLSEEDFAVTQADGKTSTNFIAIYVKAIYQLLLALSAFIAVIVFTVSGLQWLLAGGNSGSISAAKTRMEEAILGIILILSAYMIGYLLDPRVLDMNFLSIESLEPIEFSGESWDFTPRSDIPSGATLVEGSPGLAIQTRDGEAILLPEAYDSLIVAANDFKIRTGGAARLTSASRTVRRQAELFYDNCLENLGQPCEIIACNPTDRGLVTSGSSSGYRLTGVLAGVTDKETIISTLTSLGEAGNCPHTSKVAVDLWCGTGGQSGYDPRCQQELTEIMAQNGWCRLNQEPWHFEYNKYALSKSNCTMTATPRYYRNGKWHDPGSCTDWDYKENACNN